MTDIKIITQFRSVAENEHLFRSGFNFSEDSDRTTDLLNFIEQHNIPTFNLSGSIVVN